MRAYVELPIFLSLAVGLHLAVVLPDQLEGVMSSGAGGDALLSIQGASASVAAMVAKWEDVPEVTPELELAEAPPPDVPPEAPAIDPVEALTLTARLQDAPPLPMVQRDTPVPMAEPPAKPPSPDAMAVETSPRPQPRPDLRPDPVTRPEPPEPTLAPPPPPQPSRAQPTQAAPPPPPPEPAPEAPREARRNTAASAAVAPTRAAGQGGGAAAGRSGSAEIATLSQSQRQSLLVTWGAKVRARVARRAPRGVGKGRAVVEITLSGGGQLLGVRLLQSSGNAALDKAAVDAVRRAGRFPKAPAKLGISRHSFALPVAAR